MKPGTHKAYLLLAGDRLDDGSTVVHVTGIGDGMVTLITRDAHGTQHEVDVPRDQSYNVNGGGK